MDSKKIKLGLLSFVMIIVILAAGFLLFKDKNKPVQETVVTKIDRFELLTNRNHNLPFDVTCTVTEDTITAVLPSGLDLSGVVADFTFTGEKVLVNGTEVISGTTALDFSKPIELTLQGKDENSKTIKADIHSIDTGLPTVSIVTEDPDDEINKKDYSEAEFFIGGGNADSCYYAMGEKESLEVSCGIKGRGNSTWGHPKKSYTLKLEDKTPLLDMAESKDWALVANYEDYSLLRNYIAAYLGEVAEQEYVMKVRPVDTFLNGEYIGTYTLTEKIEIDENRLNITEFDENKSIDQVGYLLEFDAHVMEEIAPNGKVRGRDPGNWKQYGWMKTDHLYYNPETDETFFPIDIGGKWCTIKKPSTKNLTAEHGEYIYRMVTEAVQSLKEYNYDEVSKRIDIESFVKWYIVEEYMNNADSSMHSSVYMYLDVNGKLTLGPMWDFDRSAGNCDYWNYPKESVYDLMESGAGWFRYLFQMLEPRKLLEEEWTKFNDGISDLDTKIDEWANMIADSANHNFRTWNILGTKVASNPIEIVSAKTFEEQVAFLKEWLGKRKVAMDNFIQTLY
ncbi:MAG: Spore coat protein CotH [Herbinix sp.]|jgi:hypothetical protein|nr:Spore coat protein CotH [Herbinix sp.]